jgi:transketolase
MKKEFFNQMFELMAKNKDIYLIFVGLGYPRVDEFLKEFPGRAINTEASEQTALDIAVGLAYSGKIPFVYTITPFFYRGFETIRTYINFEKLNVKMIGAGVGKEYTVDDGYSHDASDIGKILDTQENIEQLYPVTSSDMIEMVNWMIKTNRPQFLNLHR